MKNSSLEGGSTIDLRWEGGKKTLLFVCFGSKQILKERKREQSCADQKDIPFVTVLFT